MNPALDHLLAATDAVMAGKRTTPHGALRVGVDLGTAYVVVTAVDETGTPVAGAFERASVVRDGVVVDFHGAAEVVRRLRATVEERLGALVSAAATCYPPGVALSEVRATRFVLEAAGMECTALVDEPTAANAVLGVRDGVVVDIGGGTTGLAIIRDGTVVYTADEPTGGTHFSLVIAGSRGIPFEEADELKMDPSAQPLLLGVVRPVMEKVGTIIGRHIRGHDVDHVYLVGGTAAFPGIAEVVAAITEIPTSVPGNPLFVTPLGTALHDVGAHHKENGDG